MIDVNSLIDGYRGQLPVPVFDIINDLGLGPSFRPLPDDISGWIELQPDLSYLIVINQDHPLTRRRFTAAHELGHYIYHRELLGQGTGDTRAYRAEHSPLPNAAIRPRHERQANSFAANFLMPRDVLLQMKSEVSAAEMAERLGVSQEALRIRLGTAEQ